MRNVIFVISCLFCISARASTVKPKDLTPQEKQYYNGMANRDAQVNKQNVENYLTHLKVRVIQAKRRGTTQKDIINSEWQDFIKWLIEVAGMGFTPQTDLPKLRSAFEVFIAMCDNDEATFTDATSTLLAISVKYLSYAGCEWYVPMPANLVACGTIFAPVGYSVGKVGGHYLGKFIYAEECN